MDIQNLFDKISINGFQKVVLIVFIASAGWLLFREILWKVGGGKVKDLYKPIDDKLKDADKTIEDINDEIDNMDI